MYELCNACDAQVCVSLIAPLLRSPALGSRKPESLDDLTIFVAIFDTLFSLDRRVFSLLKGDSSERNKLKELCSRETIQRRVVLATNKKL